MCRLLDSLIDVWRVKISVLMGFTYWLFIWQKAACDVVSCSPFVFLSICWRVLVLGSPGSSCSCWGPPSFLLLVGFSVAAWGLSLCVNEWKTSSHLSFFLFIYTYRYIHTFTVLGVCGNLNPLIWHWLIVGESRMVDSDQWALPKISCLVEGIHTVSQHMIFLMMTSEEGMFCQYCQWKTTWQIHRN